MTLTKKSFRALIVMFVLGLSAMYNSAQAVSIIVRPLTYNCSQTDTNKIQFDVYVKNTGDDSLGYRSHTLRFTMKRGILRVSPLPTGTLTYIPGTGDPRLAALQATYATPSSFTVTTTTLQINLGSGGTVYDHNTSPRFGPADSIWLGTFRANASVRFNCDSVTNPSWVIGTPTSISVYDTPPFVTTATVCNSTGTGLTITSGKLENGLVSANNPTGTGSLPCSILLNFNCSGACQSPATANAGSPQTVCAVGLVNLSGSIGGSATNSTWSAPSGTFSNPNSLTSTYTPGIASGSVILTLTTNDPDAAGPCTAATPTVTMTVTAASTANAGTAQSVCSGGTITLAGSIGGTATSATWSAPSGTFSDPTSLTSTYTPSISNGTVVLTLTTNDGDGAGPCPEGFSVVNITVNNCGCANPPTANAGTSQTICSGGTVNLVGLIGGGATGSTWSAPSGSFSNATSLTSTYTPSISSGSVTLTLTTDDPDGAGICTAATSTVDVVVNPAATANAGGAQTVCAGGSVTLAGIIGGSATGSTWSAASGTFSNVNSLTSTYTPSLTFGGVTLTLTTNDPDGAGPCPAATSTVLITINPAATASAGAPQTVCSGTVVTLAGVIGGSATGSTWSAPSGTFSNIFSQTSNYTPGITTGTVLLTLTTDDPDGTGPCAAVSSTVLITVNPAATANAGTAQSVCGGSSITLGGTIGGSATSSTWSAASGSFSNATSLTSTYTPSISSGSVTLTLTTDDPDGAGR